MEMLVGIMEGGWSGIPTAVREELDAAFLHHGTKGIEDQFNIARAALKCSPQGQLGPARLWHRSVVCPLLRESDVKVVQIEAEDRTYTDKLPNDTFRFTERDLSLGEDTSASYCSDKSALPWRPVHTPIWQRFKLL